MTRGQQYIPQEEQSTSRTMINPHTIENKNIKDVVIRAGIDEMQTQEGDPRGTHLDPTQKDESGAQ
jgi:hypothetical protein